MQFPNHIYSNSDHQNAVLYLNEVSVKDGVSYDYLFEYAKILWSHEHKILDDLDAKADSIIKYLGGGTGLFALGVLSKIDGTNYWIAIAALLPIVVALISIGFALAARKPTVVPGLPSVRDLKERYLDAYESEPEAKASFIAQWNLACIDMKIVCERKTDRLEYAAVAYFLAILLLLVPLGVGIYLAMAKATNVTI